MFGLHSLFLKKCIFGRMDIKVYRVGVKKWLFIFLVLLLIWPLIIVITRGINYVPKIAFVLNILILAVMLYSALTTKFIIHDGVLNVKKSLFTNLKIPVEKIKKISQYKQLFSLSASPIQLEIVYNTFDVIIIKPQNPQDFIKHLQSINSKIEIESVKK